MFLLVGKELLLGAALLAFFTIDFGPELALFIFFIV